MAGTDVQYGPQEVSAETTTLPEIDEAKVVAAAGLDTELPTSLQLEHFKAMCEPYGSDIPADLRFLATLYTSLSNFTNNPNYSFESFKVGVPAHGEHVGTLTKAVESEVKSQIKRSRNRGQNEGKPKENTPISDIPLLLNTKKEKSQTVTEFSEVNNDDFTPVPSDAGLPMRRKENKGYKAQDNRGGSGGGWASKRDGRGNDGGWGGNNGGGDGGMGGWEDGKDSADF